MEENFTLVQGVPTARTGDQRLPFHNIECVFRPNNTGDTKQSDPNSLKKLQWSDAAWATTKNMLAWMVDTLHIFIYLP